MKSIEEEVDKLILNLIYLGMAIITSFIIFIATLVIKGVITTLTDTVITIYSDIKLGAVIERVKFEHCEKDKNPLGVSLEYYDSGHLKSNCTTTNKYSDSNERYETRCTYYLDKPVSNNKK